MVRVASECATTGTVAASSFAHWLTADMLPITAGYKLLLITYCCGASVIPRILVSRQLRGLDAGLVLSYDHFRAFKLSTWIVESSQETFTFPWGSISFTGGSHLPLRNQ